MAWHEHFQSARRRKTWAAAEATAQKCPAMSRNERERAPSAVRPIEPRKPLAPGLDGEVAHLDESGSVQHTVVSPDARGTRCARAGVMPPQNTTANLAAARLLVEIVAMLRVQEAPPYRIRAYERAADAVAMFPEPLATLQAEDRLREIPQVGPAIEALLAEFVRDGAMRLHARLAADTPPGLAELLRIPGITPAIARSMHQTVGIDGLADLERAIRTDGLPDLAGPSRAKLLRQIAQAREGGRAVRLKAAWETARLLCAQLDEQAAPRRVEVAGATRRMVTEVLLDGVDLVAVAGHGGAARLLDVLGALPGVAEVVDRDDSSARVRLHDGILARLRVATPATWGGILLWQTGSSEHLGRLATLAEARGLHLDDYGLRDVVGHSTDSHDEEALYARLGLPFIAPELREDRGEIEAAADGGLPRLVEQADLRGDLHTHTDWTDGSAPLEAMAVAARARGYGYMAVTDHSQALSFINGLTPERVGEQRRLVDRLNHQLAPFLILHGTEMDILEDGRLDYQDAVLAALDYVSASVHRRHKQGREAMTARILRAVAHPLVDTLNHPFGRMVGSRDPYQVNMAAVFMAAAEAGCAVEVSGDPARMDLDGVWGRQAGLAGARCTLSTDAHSPLDLDNAWIAVGSARRAWLTPEQVLNTRPVEELRRLLRGARQRRLAQGVGGS